MGERVKMELLVQLLSMEEGFSLFFFPAVAESSVHIKVY